jgi:hypothetical protein
MNRFFGIVSAMLLGLLILVPVASAAEPFNDVQHLILSNGGDVTVPAGQHVDLLVVVDGTGTIAGDADGVVVVNGTATFTGGQAASVIAVYSTVSLDAGSSVSGDIRTYQSTVDQAGGATVGGKVIDGANDIDWTGVAAATTALAFLVLLGLVILGLAAGLTAAAVASDQVRGAGSLISREPGMTLVAAFAGLFGIILVSLLAMITVVGIPLGLAILIVVLPAVAFAGWLVVAIWIGERILERLTPQVTRERPYLAAVLGVLVLDVLSIVPFVGGIVAFFGFGAVVLYMWRAFRGHSAPAETPTQWATPVAS